MFRGTTQINLDTKGRMVLPARYREEVKRDCDGQMVITRDTDRPCLLLYKLPDWLVIEEELFKLPSSNPAVQQLQMILQGHATDVDLDGSGRILVHPSLRPIANLTKEIMLVGLGRRLEVWDLQTWNATCEDILKTGVRAREDLPPAAENIPL